MGEYIQIEIQAPQLNLLDVLAMKMDLFKLEYVPMPIEGVWKSKSGQVCKHYVAIRRISPGDDGG